MNDHGNRRALSRTYHLLRSAWAPTPGVGNVIITMVVLAVLATSLAVTQVSRRHDVLRLGYDLSRATDRLHKLRERNRALEVELATLTHPERLRSLATRLGMVPTPADEIRVVPPAPPATEEPDHGHE
ncbi:MAG: cell division protein FtsL [Kofleriaceae bacterium]|nr:cell division protein FtsL [Myxococcales bacterium]MCB9559358.1 cell division protein FtsL [Kofleriaceae bacterium]MCB9574042.1 cell division protein FtsL [Kofleriaceae bacterium]